MTAVFLIMFLANAAIAMHPKNHAYQMNWVAAAIIVALWLIVRSS